MLGSSWDPFGVMLASSWDQFGVMMGSSWDHFGVMLASSWDQFGVMLTSSWDHFGVTMASSGDQFGDIWESFWHQNRIQKSSITVENVVPISIFLFNRFFLIILHDFWTILAPFGGQVGLRKREIRNQKTSP